jgi:REP element-mobilizing transposase RayT
MPLLNDAIRQKVFEHIKDNANKKDIFLQSVNGHIDHLHCLISLGSEQSISKVIQLLKGESSFWINKNNLIHGKFEWQDEYFAVSVSESQVDVVKKYIDDQEEHHKQKTFSEEYDQFISKYNFKKLG